jgi:hypothetical protein
MVEPVVLKQPIFFDALSRNPYRLNALLYWAISSLIHKPATAIMCCDKNSTAAHFALESGFDVMSFTSVANIKQNGFWMWEQCRALGYENVLLNDKCLKSVLSARVEAGFEQLGATEQTIRQVTIDDFFAAVKEVSWIHCAYTEVAQILQGAKERILADKPVLSFNAKVVAGNLESLFILCRKLGYRLYDSCLFPIEHSAENIANITTIIALPINSDFHPKLVALLKFDSRLPNDLNARQKAELIKRYYLSLVGYQSKASILLRTYLFSDNQILLLDKLCTKSIYPREVNSEAYWHWTGPSEESLVQLCIPASGQYFFRMHTGDLPSSTLQVRAAIFINGRNVFLGDVSSQEIIEFAYDFSNVDFSEQALMTISLAKTVNIDGKIMGLCLHKIEMYVPGDELL